MYADRVGESDPGHPELAGRDLRALRGACGLTLRRLAVYSGYSMSYLSRVETDRRAATPTVVRLYATLPAASADRAAKQSPKTLSRRPSVTGRLELGIIWFGSEVRRLRMAAGKSLNTLGAEVHLSRAYLGKIEQGDARGSYQLALSLDTALKANGRLTSIFLEECARVGPVAPDTDILARGDPDGTAARGPDLAELAATAAARLETMRIRSHQAGPFSVLRDLGDGVIELYNRISTSFRTADNPVWPVTLRHAELLGWTAQETGHDAIALRWTRTAADWARAIGDADALAYALIRQSQSARRRGDAAAAVDYAYRAGAVPRISPRIEQFAAQREAQACALARDEPAFRRALDRYQTLAAEAPPTQSQVPAIPQWGPLPDSAFENSRVFEATCLVDFGDFRTAAALFDQHMGRLGSARIGYARLAVREAIAYAHIGEPERACEVVLGFLPTVARQGSASLRGDLKHLTRTLNRHRRAPVVRDLLPDLAVFARTAGSVLPSGTHLPRTPSRRPQRRSSRPCQTEST